MNEIKLGDKVKAKVSGFTGIVTGICNYLHSETLYLVEAQDRSDDTIKDYWLSRNRIELID